MRARLLAVAPLAVAVGAMVQTHGEFSRGDFLGWASLGLVALLPVAALASASAYRLTTLVWVLAWGFFGYAILEITFVALIALAFGAALRPASRSVTWRLLGAGLGLALAATVLYAVLVIPATPASVFACFDPDAPL